MERPAVRTAGANINFLALRAIFCVCPIRIVADQGCRQNSKDKQMDFQSAVEGDIKVENILPSSGYKALVPVIYHVCITCVLKSH